MSVYVYEIIFPAVCIIFIVFDLFKLKKHNSYKIRYLPVIFDILILMLSLSLIYFIFAYKMDYNSLEFAKENLFKTIFRFIAFVFIFARVVLVERLKC